MKADFQVATIGRLIVVAIPEYNHVTIIFPFPCEGTKVYFGTIDDTIKIMEEKKNNAVTDKQ